jgi:hypothetical protein
LTDKDLKDHIDKVFQQYSSRFRDFEIIFTIAIGSGIVFLAVPLGQYYLLYTELQSHTHDLTKELNSVNNNELSLALNITDNIRLINQSSTKIDNKFLGIDTESTILSLESDLSHLAGNLTSLQERQQDVEGLSETINSIRNTADRLVTNNSDNAFDLSNNKIVQTNQTRASIANDLGMIVNDTKQKSINPLLIKALEKVKSSKEQIANFIESWKSLETPFGTLPIGVSNLLATFPIGLAIGYIICILHLDHAIHTRQRLHSLYKAYYGSQVLDEDIISIAPLWLDPISRSMWITIIQFFVLTIPVILIFSISVLVILDIWFILEPLIITASNIYVNNIESLELLLSVNSVKFSESDLTIGDLPLFFGSSGSIYKEIYLNLYRCISPFFIIFVVVWYSYIKYSIS